MAARRIQLPPHTVRTKSSHRGLGPPRGTRTVRSMAEACRVRRHPPASHTQSHALHRRLGGHARHKTSV
eukprot:2795578-Prymnesium_polylepis.1